MRGRPVSRRLWVTLVSLVVAAGAVAGPMVVVAVDVGDDNAVTQRAVYGLPVDTATIRSLRESGSDVGTAKYGFPLTAAEDEKLDLNGRIRFADQVSKTVMPFARSLSAYAGAYIDQRTDGSLVVMLTELDPAVVAAIKSRAPADAREVRVASAVHTERELIEGRDEVAAWWTKRLPDVALIGVDVDSQSNGLVVKVSEADLALVRWAGPEAAEQVGVPVSVVSAPPGTDVVCTNRDNCHTPMRAGIRIRAGGANTSNVCTMGFHIVIGGTDEQFLTAGHCGCLFTSTNWYHQGLGFVGGEVARLTNLATHKKDVMRVQINDAQASPLMYADSGEMGDSALPIANETIYASFGASNVKLAAAITSVSVEYWSNYCGANMDGADTNITGAIFGDSGTPIYRRFSFGGEWYMTPIGILSRSDGYFARVEDAQNAWNFTVVHP